MAAEKIFENKVKNYINDIGGWKVKFFANSYTESGIPDLLCCINGVFVAIEVKAEHGKPSLLQIHTVRKIIKSGGVAIILYPQDFEKFKLLVKFINISGIRSDGVVDLMNQINEKGFSYE